MRKGLARSPLLGCSVLIADKNPSAQKPLKDELNSLGVKNIDVASDLQDLLKKLSRGYDLLFLDTHLSDKRSGSALLEEVRASSLPEKTAIFIISGDRGASFLHSIVEHAPDGYIIKPYSPEELSNKVVSCVEKKKAILSLTQLASDLSRVNELLETADRLEEEYPQHRREIFKKKIDCLLKLSQYREAESLLEKRLASDAHPWMKVALAKCFVQSENFEGAESILNEAVSDLPEYVESSDALAKLLYSLGRPAEAYSVIESMGLLAFTNMERIRLFAGLSSEVDSSSERSIIQKGIDRSGGGRLASAFDYHRLSSLYIEEGKEAEALSALAPLKNISEQVDSEMAEGLVSVKLALKKDDETRARESLFAMLRKVDVRATSLSASSSMELTKLCMALKKEETAKKYFSNVDPSSLGFWHSQRYSEMSLELERLLADRAEAAKIEEDRPEAASIEVSRKGVNGELAKKLKGVMSESN